MSQDKQAHRNDYLRRLRDKSYVIKVVGAGSKSLSSVSKQIAASSAHVWSPISEVGVRHSTWALNRTFVLLTTALQPWRRNRGEPDDLSEQRWNGNDSKSCRGTVRHHSGSYGNTRKTEVPV